MDRRTFLRNGALTAAAAATGAVPPALGRALATLGDAAAPAPASTLTGLGIAELQEGMAAGALSAQAIVAACLERIAALDRQGPALCAVLETNPDALAIAAELDDERREQGPRGPLHGIPILLKDNLDTADRMTTTAGSLALEGSTPPSDSTVAARLREAGAVLLGKANLSEWANIRSTRSSSGWSARGGQCRNPYVLDRNPCGSSSGSAVAVAAAYCPVAVGTETDGSIVCPSSINGIVGIKPTLGLVSRAGIIPIAHSQDTAGPMARTVRDAAILLGAMAGEDPRDPATRTSGDHRPADYLTSLSADGLRSARIGVARSFWGADERVDRLMEAALDAMRSAGAVLVDPVELETGEEYGESELTVLLYELKADLEAYLASLGPTAPVRTLAEVIAFNEAHADREMPYFGQEHFLAAQEKGGLDSKEYLDALARNRRLAGAEGIDTAMREHRLDAIVAPTGGPAWLTDLVAGDHFSGPSSSTPPAVAGYPAVTVPAGFIHGLPVGITFMGAAWSEPQLLRLAFAFEQATAQRRAPGFLPSAILPAPAAATPA